MPEFIKKSERNVRDKWVKRYYFCHVGRTGGRSLIWNFIQDGWKVLYEDPLRPTREEAFEHYAKKRGTDRIIPVEKFSIVRHPVSRIESHVRWAKQTNNFTGTSSEYFDFIDYSLDNLYEKKLERQLIPAFETVFFDSTVLQYELGFRRIAEYFVEERIVNRWKANKRIREDAKVRINWSSCPEALKDKIFKIYEKDFEVFDYDPDIYFKK